MVGKSDKTRQHNTIPVRLDDVEIGVENDEVSPKICMVDSILLNPNSYKNVEEILMEFKKTARIGEDRRWVFLGCDGPPYCWLNESLTTK